MAENHLQKTAIIALWAAPRTVSTPVERVFIERADAQVFHEPFFNAFYYSKDSGTSREIPQDISFEKKRQDYSVIIDQLLAPCEQPIRFFKDMALYSFHYLTAHFPEFYQKVIHTFIIRNPRDALISHYKISPDFGRYPEEAGFQQQYALFKYVTETLQQPAIVIEANQLCDQPDQVLHQYCKVMGIPYESRALSWQAGVIIPDWQDWQDWHIDTLNSTGIYPAVEEVLDHPVPTWLEQLIQDNQQYYDRMLPYALLAS